MELQLGLALPTNAFDLNTHAHNHKEVQREKQTFDLCSTFRRTLPLLLWNNQPNDDDDENSPNDRCRTACAFFSIDRNEEQNGLVGWPPLKTRRRRLYTQKRGVRAAENRRALEIGGGVGNGGLNSRYVKVKMEGVGIARKVDLSVHSSFAALEATLTNMFDEKDLNAYRLTYQDMEGDWLLAEDVAWRNFIRTAQRIKLEKSNG